MSVSGIKVLVLCCRYSGTLSYFTDWEDAFQGYPGIQVEVVDLFDGRDVARLRPAMRDAGLVVALHSTNGDDVGILEPYVALLNDRRCPLLAFVGNEYNTPEPKCGMRSKIGLLRSLAPQYIATQLPLDSGRTLYEGVAGAQVVSIPHALNPKRFWPDTPQGARKIDIGVRSARYLPFLGDNDRLEIIEYFSKLTDPQWVMDISLDPNDRLTADKWNVFLNACRGTVATEAGTGYLETDDETVIRVSRYIHAALGPARGALADAKHRGVGRGWPESVKSLTRHLLAPFHLREPDLAAVYEGASFPDVFDRFFRNYQRPLSGKCISSRHFDAIGTKTCQIMFAGRFNDILQADRHYIALKRDFSNIADVLERFHDLPFREKMVKDAYDYVMASHTYHHRVHDILRLLS